MKRGDKVTFVPVWTDSRDKGHPDREPGLIVGLASDCAKVRFKDHLGEHDEWCRLSQLEPA